MTKGSTPQLERVLSLGDLVLFNLVAVIGITWVATAAKAGPSSLTLWLLAAIFFFVPQGLAVIQLSSSFPAEGGIYAWTKNEFGEGHGTSNVWIHEAKLGGGSLFLIALGLLIYRRANQRQVTALPG